MAVKAVRAAGKLINRAELDLDKVRVGLKGPGDFVTETDQAAEQTIIEVLKKAFPDHAILAEESGASGQSDFEWLIDPIDGTTNFIHGYPHYAVSIALRVKGVIQQAVIYNPATNDLFTASKGEGAYLNSRRIRVSKRHKSPEYLIGFAFPTSGQPACSTPAHHTMNALSSQVAGVRKTGSAVLDLAYVACGWLDGHLGFGLQPWDIAAGSLLVSEAGGLITDHQGNSDFLSCGQTVAGNPKTLQFLLQNL